jgi:uncharacterized repeat protein (TIGR01451 family)
MKIIKRMVLTAGFITFVLSASVAWAAAGQITIGTKAEQLITTTDEYGNKIKKRIPASKVVPGEIVYYTTWFENIGKQAADDINITDPIPKHTVYVPNSARGENTTIRFSVDGGKHWGKEGSLKVRGADGKMRPATARDYTHIRWQYNGSLQPKEKQAVGFQARLL